MPQEEPPPIAVVARALPPIVTSVPEVATERILTPGSLGTPGKAAQLQPMHMPGMPGAAQTMHTALRASPDGLGRASEGTMPGLPVLSLLHGHATTLWQDFSGGQLLNVRRLVMRCLDLGA